MKINNRKAIKVRLFLYTSIIIIALTGIMLNFLLRFHTLNSYFVFSLSAIFILIALRNLFRLKYFDYEHSGEVVTIRYYSVFAFGRIFHAVEVPKQKILSSSVQKKGKTHHLKLRIKTRNGRRKKFGFRLVGFSIEQIDKMRNSLLNMV